MSSAEERLVEVFNAYAAAFQRRLADLSEATTETQVVDILNNVRNLEGVYLRAATAALDASGAAVEQALANARSAKDAIDAAYANAKAIGEKIRLVSKGAKAVADLVKKAQDG
jgi:hypothetical protein